MKTLKKIQNTSTSEHGKLAEEKTQKKNHSWKVQNSERDRTNSCASAANNYNSPKQIWSHWRKDKQRIVYLWNQILQKREDIECACHGMNLLAKHVAHGLLMQDTKVSRFQLQYWKRCLCTLQECQEFQASDERLSVCFWPIKKKQHEVHHVWNRLIWSP